jgi:hypothetical protein
MHRRPSTPSTPADNMRGCRRPTEAPTTTALLRGCWMASEAPTTALLQRCRRRGGPNDDNDAVARLPPEGRAAKTTLLKDTKLPRAVVVRCYRATHAGDWRRTHTRACRSSTSTCVGDAAGQRTASKGACLHRAHACLYTSTTTAMHAYARTCSWKASKDHYQYVLEDIHEWSTI